MYFRSVVVPFSPISCRCFRAFCIWVESSLSWNPCVAMSCQLNNKLNLFFFICMMGYQLLSRVYEHCMGFYSRLLTMKSTALSLSSNCWPGFCRNTGMKLNCSSFLKDCFIFCLAQSLIKLLRPLMHHLKKIFVDKRPKSYTLGYTQKLTEILLIQDYYEHVLVQCGLEMTQITSSTVTNHPYN